MAPGCDRVSWVLCENLPFLVQASAASTADFSVSCADSRSPPDVGGPGLRISIYLQSILGLSVCGDP